MNHIPLLAAFVQSLLDCFKTLWVLDCLYGLISYSNWWYDLGLSFSMIDATVLWVKNKDPMQVKCPLTAFFKMNIHHFWGNAVTYKQGRTYINNSVQTTKRFWKFKIFLLDFLNFQAKKKFEKKFPSKMKLSLSFLKKKIS